MAITTACFFITSLLALACWGKLGISVFSPRSLAVLANSPQADDVAAGVRALMHATRLGQHTAEAIRAGRRAQRDDSTCHDALRSSQLRALVREIVGLGPQNEPLTVDRLLKQLDAIKNGLPLCVHRFL